MLISNGSYVTKIVPAGIPVGIIEWDGIDDKIGFPSHPDVTGSKTITFNAVFESYGVSQAEDVFVFGSNSNDYLDVTYITNVERMRVAASVSGGSIDYDISGIIGTQVEIEIIKTAGVIVSTKANGNALPIFTTGSGNSATSESTIGYHPDVGAFKYLHHALLWDIQIDGVGLWKGYPAGNTNTAWEDQIGAIDGSVFGDPSITP